ncbi:hypothetical protein KC19_12G090300 [Ceratodon purpureus]|uniref:Calcineurin-like phosphoesterase domain-containing protein n=1 Tax=Ceratodon purpureus TaxID=3225 RepID=A0A8T0G667_CERPU|nr:hypothetical protein KC19_12G090300 [Ceratodon purpureus]
MWSSRFRGILILALLWSLDVNFVSSAVTNGGAVAEGEVVGAVEMEGAPSGVVWVVQMSDIHISKWVSARGRALRRSLGRALKLIKPAIVLVTGDLTDAKNKDMTTTQQEEVEWIEYRDSFQKVADESGIPLKKFYDLRGNHDKYGVPLQSPLDYHSKYSISAAMNRSGLLQNVTVQGRDGRKHLFVGFDDSMHVGLRGPSNVFGHPTDEVLVQLDQELKRWDESTADPVTKIVYGHFPMSFTTSSETGKRVEDVMANNDVTAYLCGHLHTTFGRRLYKHHKERTGDFWEWEMGDWRVSRMMRVLAIDHGHTSFVDVELLPPTDTSEGVFTMPTVILQTYPLDSRFMLQSSGKGADYSDIISKSIRALVFSETTPASVRARVYDFSSHPPTLVTENFMNITEDGIDGIDRGAHYYSTFWDSSMLSHGLKYAIQIVAESTNGTLSYSEMRFVSAGGHPGEFHLTILAFLVMGFKWETVFPLLLWGMIILLSSLLVASKLFFMRLEKDGQYEDWMISVFRPSSTPSGALGKVVKVPFWAFVECSRNNLVWVGLMLYVAYLIFFPWFSGRVLADDYPIGRMSLHGWTVKPSNVDSVQTISGLGIPDIMVIVMSYMIGVMLPLLLMISALSAERAACEFHLRNLAKCHKTEADASKADSFEIERNRDSDDVFQGNAASASESMVHGSSTNSDCMLQTHGESDPLISRTKEPESGDHHCNLCSRKVRKGLFVGCLAVAFVHWRLCLVIAKAYGFSALATAPAYAWSVPILLIFSIFQTSRVRCRPLSHEH